MYRSIKKEIEKSRRNFSNGLTLVELLVVISIFMIITAIVIFNYSNFSSSVSMQNLTDDIALSIRKAQSFAIGARGVKDDNENINFMKSYGMHFSSEENQTIEDKMLGSSKSFIMFSTPTTNKFYVRGEGICGSPTTECIELFEILSVDKIKEIKAYDSSSNPILPISLDASIDIVFTRPSPRADFCYKENPSTISCDTNISKVDITVSNNDDEAEKMKVISVQNTGQISISNK